MGILLLILNSCKIPTMLFQANWKVSLKISVKFGIFFFVLKAASVFN